MKIFLFLILGVCVCTLLQAQSFYNTGEMTIAAGTEFSVRDSLVNKGTLTNNGNMIMGGVWFNTGSYIPGNGEITFNAPSGQSAQVINHSNQSFGKLTISGGGEKLILADITVVESLTLTDGVILSQNNAKIVFSPGAVINGGSDQSHVNASVTQQGSGQKVFPLGNGTSYLPVVLDNVGNTTASVKITAVEGAQSLNPGFDLQSVLPERYWIVEPATAADVASTTISLPVRSTGFSNIDDLVVAQAGDVNSDLNSIGQSDFTGTAANGVLTSLAAPTKAIIAIAFAADAEGDITVFNAVSPNADEMNDFLMIGNIELFPGNIVKIFNRWGDKVYEQKNYDNATNNFTGKSNVGGSGDLPNGIYFYSINKGDGTEEVTGYLSLKR